MTPGHPAGTFAWYDLMSTDPAASRAFYAALFGWAVTEGDRPRFLLPGGAAADPGSESGEGGAPIAAIIPLDPEEGWPSHWMSYLATPDVDAAAGRVLAAGGEVFLPPTDIPGVGRFIVAADPLGAVFSALHLARPTPIDRATPGTIGWNDLLTPDEESRRFYAAVFGYSVVPGEGAGTVLLSGGEAQAGVRASTRVTPPVWVPYVVVRDFEAALARAEGLGARVIERSFRVPGVGRFGVLADPLGAVFGVWA